MNIRILGGGWYGCHIALSLIKDGHAVVLEERAAQLFSGASGGNPARLHLGFHYPRSALTRTACQDHYAKFMKAYGFLTRHVPVNIYAVAENDSVVDFGTYCHTLESEVEFIRIVDPKEFGLRNVEGAVLTGERHIVIQQAREFFEEKLAGHVLYGDKKPPKDFVADWTIDCTFCANDNHNIDRYEPCVTALLRGPVDKAVTIMDGPFPSIYPWNEEQGVCSLTSAKFTPLARCNDRAQAESIVSSTLPPVALARAHQMMEQMANFWPESSTLYGIGGYKLSIRAMPRSGADARLVDVVQVAEKTLRIRAGKIDAILYAEQMVKEMLSCSR